MMTHIRKWALAVCSALLLTSYSATTNAQNINSLDPSQVYSTGNLVNNNPTNTATTGAWQNVGLWNQGLPCWSPEDAYYRGAYCGPQPYFNQGSFNFSWGVTDVYQIVGIAAALPNSGSGLRVNGYNFGFMAKNGNGWDGAGLDTLSAYVNVYGADGKSVRNDYYNLNYQFDWSVFNFSKTFDSPYVTKDLSTVRYGFIGGDTSNQWAGPYGPEVTNISFSLRYSVDPCSVNVLSSPNCPGYLDKINTLSATPAVSSAPTATAATGFVAISPAAVSSSVDPAQPNNNASSSGSASTSPTPTATNPQPLVGEIVTPGSAPKTISTAQILGMIRSEQSRITALENSTANQAVSEAQHQSESAQTQSLAISAATITGSKSALQSFGAGPSSIYSLSSGPVAGPSVEIGRSSADDSRGEGIKFSPTNLISNLLNNTTMPAEPAQEHKTSAVNNKAQDNEAAGSISIAAIARTPVGFEAYSAVMPDSAFYAPKEIYRNQHVVDNARSQRLLQGASDKLHQQMMDQQYQRNQK